LFDDHPQIEHASECIRMLVSRCQAQPDRE
jgi:hypothetical protein